ncbi:MAG: DinB family protein [Bacteroidetes bacterium]|nr:DinB family protein [Bacteroidota bacterium]
MTLPEKKQLIRQFRDGSWKLELALKSVPAEAIDFRPAPGKWTIHEIVVHLADSEAVGYNRCRRIVAESGSDVFAYDQDAWANELFYSKTRLEDAVVLFNLLRKLNTELLQQLDESAFSRFVIHPERGQLTLEAWVEMYTRHVDVHLAQIQRNLEAFKS